MKFEAIRLVSKSSLTVSRVYNDKMPITITMSIFISLQRNNFI